MKRISILLIYLSICYVIMAQALEKTYGNKFFSFNYPSNWEIVQEDNAVTVNTTISVQVMAKQMNNVDFRPNVNIIKSPKKRTEETSYLAQLTLNHIKQIMPNIIIKGKRNVTISGCNGTMAEYECTYNGYSMHFYQYIVKKVDNTTFTITCTIDNSRLQTQKKIVDAIISSLKIK